MRNVKKEVESPSNPNISPSHSTATTMEGRENELIALAYDAVEERIRNRTATSAELVHFLQLGSMKERLKRENLNADTELKRAKIDAVHQAEYSDQLYLKAIDAIKEYTGKNNE